MRVGNLGKYSFLWLLCIEKIFLGILGWNIRFLINIASILVCALELNHCGGNITRSVMFGYIIFVIQMQIKYRRKKL